MSLSNEGLTHFAELYKNEFAEDLTPEDLERKARTLINLYIAIYSSPLEVVKSQSLIDDNKNENG